MRRTHLEKNILFISDDHTCLSLMAESMAKHMRPPRARVSSATIKPVMIPAELHQVLREIGVDLSASTSKSLDQMQVSDVDLVVSFGEAHSKCPSLPKNTRIEKWPITNPVPVDDAAFALSTYRHEREEIGRRLAALFLDHWRHAE
jgi:protein-tyrosine-phosphatase